MQVLIFLLGLAIGLALWSWQRFQFELKLNVLLRDFKLGTVEPSYFTSISQLSLAIACQQQVREQLERRIDVFQQIFMVAPIGYLQVDDENRLLWCNPKARELLGITHIPLQEAPRLLIEIVRSYDLDQLIEQTRLKGQPCQNDWVFYHVNSNPSQISKQEAQALRGYGFPLPDDCVGIFLENRQEAAVLKQQRDRWASDVAHELKTPLTSIRLVAETLQSRMDASLSEWMTRLINETIRLSNLVQDLLELGQLDRHSTDCLNYVVADLVELVHEAWTNLEPLARRKNLKLDYVGPEHLMVEIDKQRMYRVLINLLDNAIRHSPSWQHIQVKLSVDVSSTPSSELQYHQALLELIDAGPGFQEDDLPFVFERFYRADPSRSRQIPLKGLDHQRYMMNSVDMLTGETQNRDRTFSDPVHGSESYQSGSSGLGLSIVRQIVEAHKGNVVARNHPETHGAWLQVYLPCHQPKLLGVHTN